MCSSSQAMEPICSVGQLSHGDCLEFNLVKSPTEIADNVSPSTDAFLISWNGKFFAYVNSCPHTHVNLNWSPDQFFDLEIEFIQCSMHGALFEPDSGLCIRGPCLGQSLQQLPVRIENGMVFVGSDD
jgi:nitrite reductase/ring-hydroxylating ferredoxin subunit